MLCFVEQNQSNPTHLSMVLFTYIYPSPPKKIFPTLHGAFGACFVINVPPIFFWIQVPSTNAYLVVSGPVIWIPEMLYERDCYLGVSRFESQTTNLPILVEFPFRQLYIYTYNIISYIYIYYRTRLSKGP